MRVFGGEGGWCNMVSHNEQKSQVSRAVVSIIVLSRIESDGIKASCRTSNQS